MKVRAVALLKGRCFKVYGDYLRRRGVKFIAIENANASLLKIDKEICGFYDLINKASCCTAERLLGRLARTIRKSAAGRAARAQMQAAAKQDASAYPELTTVDRADMVDWVSKQKVHDFVRVLEGKKWHHLKSAIQAAIIKTGGSHNEKESAVGFLEAWKIPRVAPFAVLVEYLRNDQRCQDKVEEENGVRSSNDGFKNESEKDDVDKSKEKEDAIEKMNETKHVSEETQENDATENEKSETKATQENDGKDNEKSESEDNHNEDDHVKEVDNVNENENKSDRNDQSVREENRKGDDALSEVVDDSQKTAKPIQRSRWCSKITSQPEVFENKTNKTLDQTRRRNEWENDDYICRGHILNGISDSLYDIYQNVKSARELWDSLESKYIAKMLQPYVHMVEENNKKDNNYKGNVKKRKYDGPDKSDKKSQELVCYGCQKVAHMKGDCRVKLGKNGAGKVFVMSEQEISDNTVEEELTLEEDLDEWLKNEMKEQMSKPEVEDEENALISIMKTIRRYYEWSAQNYKFDNDRTLSTTTVSDKYNTYYPTPPTLQNPQADECIPKAPNLGESSCLQPIKPRPYSFDVEEGYAKEIGNPYSRRFDEYKRVFSGDVEQLSNEYMLRIRKKGYVQDDVWEKCEQYHEETLDHWHDKGFEKEELWRSGDEKIDYEPPFVDIKTFEIKKYSFKRGRNFTCITKMQDEALPLGRVNGVKFKVMTRKLNELVSFNNVIKSRDAIFDELRFSSIKRLNDMTPKNCEDDNSEILKGSKDEVGMKYYFGQIGDDPKTMEAWDVALWKEAIDDEMSSILKNKLGCCLIYRLMDVKIAFLNGDLEERVPPMNQPEGFVMSVNEHKLCKRVKSLYELKHAQEQCHQKFDDVILSSGFFLNQSDKCIYSRFDSSSLGVIIYLYVDDMLISSTDQQQVDETKDILSSKFSMKDMGEANVILGIRIKQANKGSLMYAMTRTRRDIAYVVRKLRKYTSNPGTQHLQAIQRVFKYLKGTVNYGLSYSAYPSVLEGYFDTSWISTVEDHSSTSGCGVCKIATKFGGSSYQKFDAGLSAQVSIGDGIKV
ncbi:zinc finger, CCHC-type containing protein [Tanacetum coccineum]